VNENTERMLESVEADFRSAVAAYDRFLARIKKQDEIAREREARKAQS